MLYPLFIFKTEKGFNDYFPDIEGCFFPGDGIDDTIKNAEVAFSQHMEILTEQAGHAPAPQNSAIDRFIAINSHYKNRATCLAVLARKEISLK